MKQNHPATKKEHARMTGLALILLLIIWATPAAGQTGNGDYFQEKHLVPGLSDVEFNTLQERSQDGLESLHSMRRYLMGQIQYPEDAVNQGNTGTVELYARINHQGIVNEILLLQPESDYLEFREIIIRDSAPAGMELTESARHESLLSECKRVLVLLPKCNIQDVLGRTLKFTFTFVLE